MNRVSMFRQAVTTAVCLLLVAGVAWGDLGTGLVTYWPLDDGPDDAWSNLDGEERNGPLDYEAGMFGNGVYLDGTNQFIEIMGGDADELDFVGSPMTVSTWFSVEEFDTEWQGLIAKGENDGWRIHRMALEFGMTFVAGSPEPPSTGVDIDDGEMHHLVAVSAPNPNTDAPNGMLSLYIDGELLAEQEANPIGLPTTNNRVRIGDNPSTSNREWWGVIDDAAIWARALNEDEVAEIWNNGDGASVGSLIQGTTAVPARFVAGSENIGALNLQATVENPVFGPGGEVGPGLVQEWYAGANPGSKDGIDAVALAQEPMVPAFKAGHGASWWTGNVSANSPVLDGLLQYPDEVDPPLDSAGNNDNYMAILKGEILIPESGAYRFTDGVDDYTYLAIDIDKSGEAGDDPDEVLIDDNAWTSVLRMDNNGGGGYADVDIDVAAGGEWLAMEFYMGEGGGDDAGIIYWDYDPNAPEGDRIGGAVGFPEFTEESIVDEFDAAEMYIPDSHLRSGTPGQLLSADLVAELSNSKAWEVDVDGDADTADVIAVPNNDPNVYTSMLDLNDSEFRIVGTGTLQPGDTFQIVDADQITGNVTISSGVEGQSWSFNPATGEVTFGGGGVVALQAGDADQDLDFDQLDLVKVQIAAKYLTGEAATWGDGDWDAAPGGSVGSPPQGDGVFGQTDIIAALTNGLYLAGPYGALAPGGDLNDEQTSIVYDPGTGEVRVNAPASTMLTSVNIDSASGIFVNSENAQNLDGSFDTASEDNIFKATFGSSFGSLSFGEVATAGLSEEFVTDDLSAIGSLDGGGGLGDVDLIYVPEPSSLLLLSLALAGALMTRMRRRI